MLNKMQWNKNKKLCLNKITLKNYNQKKLYFLKQNQIKNLINPNKIKRKLSEN